MQHFPTEQVNEPAEQEEFENEEFENEKFEEFEERGYVDEF